MFEVESLINNIFFTFVQCIIEVTEKILIEHEEICLGASNSVNMAKFQLITGICNTYMS